VEDLGEEELKN
jgi:hypothetical protein